MVAKVCVASSIFTFSLASIAWWRPSEYRLPSIILPVCSSTILTLLSITTYSISFSNSVYAFNNWFKVCILSLFSLKSEYNFSFSSASFSISNSFDSIFAISIETSGKTKKPGSLISFDNCSTPLSVNSIWLFFSSIVKYKSASTLGISLLLSCM